MILDASLLLVEQGAFSAEDDAFSIFVLLDQRADLGDLSHRKHVAQVPFLKGWVCARETLFGVPFLALLFSLLCHHPFLVCRAEVMVCVYRDDIHWELALG